MHNDRGSYSLCFLQNHGVQLPRLWYFADVSESDARKSVCSRQMQSGTVFLFVSFGGSICGFSGTIYKDRRADHETLAEYTVIYHNRSFACTRSNQKHTNALGESQEELCVRFLR